MGRPERPLNPEAGPVQRLARDLRELRRAAGSPPYRTMAETAGFSATTLSQAASGYRLPALAVVEAFARVCGANPGEWKARWETATGEASTDEDASPPYRGLARFEPGDRELFFGRERLVEELKQLVDRQRFAAVFGPSGSGKSSLIRAGLVPALQERTRALGSADALRILTPGPRPATTYGHLLAPTQGDGERWVMVDQFEEVFTLCRDASERTYFIDLLLAARSPDSGLRVVIAVRADFLVRCAEHRELADALRGNGLLVGPLTADELRDVVAKPAQKVGLLVERELTARIVEEVRDQPGALPLLSHALLETWRRRWGRVLSTTEYEAAGGLRGVIASTAEEVYGELSEPQARVARRLLLRLVEPGRGTPDIGRSLTLAELDEWTDPDLPVVVERLVRARLLTFDEAGVRLAHDTLLTGWPCLAGWLEEDRERLRHHRQLSEAARAWLEHDREPGSLYRGASLARAEEMLAAGALTCAEKAFLTAGIQARDTERRVAARSARRARTLTITVSTALVLAMIAGALAWRQRQENDHQHTEAAVRRMAVVAEAARDIEPRTAMLLGVAAWRTAPLPEARRAVLGALFQVEQATFRDPAPGAGPQRFLTGSGRTLLSVEGRTWRTWDVTTHRRTGSGRLPAGEVVAASADGTVLAVSGNNGVRLWDRTTARWASSARPLPTPAVSFGAGKRSYLVRATDGHHVALLSVAHSRVLFKTRAVALGHLAASADGRLVASCPEGGQAPQVREIDGRKVLSGPWQKARGICDQDDSTLVFGGNDLLAAVSMGRIRVWDVRTARLTADIRDPGAILASFSPDGRFLATAGRWEVRAWRLSDTQTPAFRLYLNNKYLRGLVWDPARPVLRYLEGSTVHSLDVTAALTPSWRDTPSSAVRLAPDGSALAVAERIGGRYRFQLLDPRDGRVMKTLRTPPIPVIRTRSRQADADLGLPLMTFSPDSTAFAYGLSAPTTDVVSQRIAVQDLRTGRARDVELALTPAEVAKGVSSLALGPEGDTLYTARTTTTGEVVNEVWDVARGNRIEALVGPAGTRLAVRPDGGLLVGEQGFTWLPPRRTVPLDLVRGDQGSAVAFSPDGTILAVGDRTGRVALWDGRLGSITGLLCSHFPPPLGGTPEAVSALALSPDGRTLAVGGDAGTLQLWDMTTQQPLGGSLPTPGEGIASLAFSPDGGALYAAGLHVPLQRYTVDPSRAAVLVCRRVRGDLSRGQWSMFVSGVPYRRVCADERRLSTSGT